MRRFTISAAVAVGCLLSLVQTSVWAQGFRRDNRADKINDFTAADVRNAIKLGVEGLEARQRASGEWSGFENYGSGVTALATLALINAVDDPNTPAIEKGLRRVIDERAKSTYFVSLRVMCLANADPEGERFLREVQKDIDWLVSVQSPTGGWAYGRNNRAGSPDSSNSQFALLALHEAAQMGAVIDERVWTQTKKYWESCRAEGGGYSYNVGGRNKRRTMSAAGMASMIIIDENLPNLGEMFRGGRVECCAADPDEDHEQETADSIGKEFSLGRNVAGGGHQWKYYFMYALERAGRLSGRRFFGSHDWYREGASRLIDWRVDGRGWKGGSLENENIATAMALLFLAKGKRPIAIGKYLFDSDQDKLHRKGVHYLTRNLEKTWNLKLNWQEVRSADATPDDLLESPVLFMSGNGGFVLTDFQKESLKTYLENGGFLFADACQGEGCGRAEFDRSFRELMVDIFPDSPLEPLPPNHPVWTSHHSLDRPDERPLLGLQACCKTSVIYCPRNLACLWNADRPGVKRQMKNNRRYKRLLDEIEYATKVGVNVVTYATGRELKEKGDRPKLEGKAKSVLVNRSLELPKLVHSGGHDEAPNAWRKIQQRFAESGISVNLKKKFVSPDLDQLSDHPFIFMHGRRAFTFTEEQRDAIKMWLESGFGFIFADSICSSKEFTESFRSEMTKILGEPLKPIPADHAIWTDPELVFEIKNVTLRRKRADGGKFDEIQGPPELEGHEVNGRLAVVFSPNDLSCAMESTTVSQCDGYKREDAERIGINVLLYRLRVE